MGFGLLLVGYMTLLIMKMVPIEIVGFFIMYIALDKLQSQEKNFRYAKYASVYMFFESVLGSASWFATTTKVDLGFISTESFQILENILYHSGLLVFHLLLYYGIRSIAKKVGYDKAVGRARFASIGTVIFYVAQLCASFIDGGQIMVLPLAAFQILWMLYNLYMFLGCYMMIVTDEMLEKEEQKFNEFLEKNNKYVKQRKKTVKDIAENSRKEQKNNTKKSGTNRQTYRATKK